MAQLGKTEELHWTEARRLSVLHQYGILDTPREEDFDDIVELASQICEVPISIVNLIDKNRQWFKAEIGFGVRETPLDNSICAHAILQSELFIVPDTTKDQRFNCNPLVTGDPKLRFYAGALLKNKDGIPLGTLCVLDYKPRELSRKQLFALQALARQVMTQLELRHSLKERENTEQRLRLPFQAAEFAGFWDWNLETNLLTTDARFARVYGIDPELAAAGAPLNEYIKNIHADDMARITPSIERTITSGGNYSEEYRILQPDGSVVWVAASGSGHSNSDGKVIRFDGVAINISERKQREEELLAVERFAQGIIDSSTDCIKVLDLNGNLLSLNQGGCTQMEVDDISLCINQPWPSFWQGEEREEAKKALALAQTGKTGRFEGFCATMKGTPKWWEVIVSPIMGADEKPIRVLCVSRDITARKKLETDAQEAQKTAEAANMAKTEFLANMSHEIRTPMNAVVGLAHILALSQPLSPKQKECIKTLQMSADSLLSLINDLLDIAKIEAQTVELEHIPFSIIQLIQETISMMNVRAREKNLNFNLVQECARIEKRMLIGDPTRVRQILLNLCSNAIKFTDKGSVSIHISSESMAGENKEMVEISVQDSGIGIPADQVGTIFQKFIQADSSINRKYGGTGLGLAITKTLAEIMGGAIKVSSEVGVGSKFTVSLPFEISTETNIEQFSIVQSTAKEVRSLNKKVKSRILLVEDYAPNVMVAVGFLEMFGYETDVSPNGLDAIEKAKHNEYATILMDVQMHGMNGLEATQHIRAHELQVGKPKAYIIGMTAHALAGDRERCLAVGMNDYIAKPFNPDLLQEMLFQQVADSAA